MARASAQALGATGIEFLQGSWLAPLAGQRFAAIVANPPYIDAGDPHLQQGDLRFEPRLALTPGEDGLAAIRTIVAAASAHLDPGGVLAFEHGYTQAAQCRDLLARNGFEAIEPRNRS